MTPCPLGGTAGKAAILAISATVLGAAHSWRAPIVLHPSENKAPTTIPLTPPAPAPTPSVAAPKSDQSPPTRAPSSDGGTPAPSTRTPPSAPATITLGLEITLDQAAMLYEMKSPFIDAREPNFFAEGHVLGAINLTADQVVPRSGEIVQFRDQPVVIYCGGGDCDASHNVAKRLQMIGFTRVHIMKDGMPAWKAAGKPVATGP